MLLGKKWVFKKTLNENGEVIRNKAILLSKGYAQQEGIHFEETFSPIGQSQIHKNVPYIFNIS